jgi:predicted secreted hydrolase
LGGVPDAGFKRAITPRTFSFPADHGAHPGFRTEWWYLTGNLQADNGDHYGFQLTLFRNALAPTSPAEGSTWRTNEVYMGHFALTDVANKEFHAFERFARPVAGQAGARNWPLRAWLGNWIIRADERGWHASAAANGVRIDLALTPQTAPVLQGDGGLSQKSAEPGNASYYYSLPNLVATGRLDAGRGEVAVTGSAWLDREWSTSSLAPDQAGWDWFALQLADGRQLMYYRLRRIDGSIAPFSSGTLIAADGSSQRIRAEQVRLEELADWLSPSGIRYPARWRLQVPDYDIDLSITPLLANQELPLSVYYWEGAVAVEQRGAAAGFGYVELAGYDNL